MCRLAGRGSSLGKPPCQVLTIAMLTEKKSFAERTTLIRFIRATLDEAGLRSTPIVAGVGGSSTRETIQLAQSAAEAGA